MTSASAALRGFGPVVGLLFGLQFVSMGAMEMSGPFWPIQIKLLSPSEGAFGLAGIGVYLGPMIGEIDDLPLPHPFNRSMRVVDETRQSF